MADQLTDDPTAIRDAVRERYAAAARAVTDTRDGACAPAANADCWRGHGARRRGRALRRRPLRPRRA